MRREAEMKKNEKLLVGLEQNILSRDVAEYSALFVIKRKSGLNRYKYEVHYKPITVQSSPLGLRSLGVQQKCVSRKVSIFLQFDIKLYKDI